MAYAIIERIYLNGEYVANKEVARFPEKQGNIKLTKNQSWAKIVNSGKYEPWMAYPSAFGR